MVQAVADVTRNLEHVTVSQVDMVEIVSINVLDSHMELDVPKDVNVVDIDHVVAIK